jgi:hypothetical protein
MRLRLIVEGKRSLVEIYGNRDEPQVHAEAKRREPTCVARAHQHVLINALHAVQRDGSSWSPPPLPIEAERRIWTEDLKCKKGGCCHRPKPVFQIPGVPKCASSVTEPLWSTNGNPDRVRRVQAVAQP